MARIRGVGRQCELLVKIFRTWMIFSCFLFRNVAEFFRIVRMYTADFGYVIRDGAGPIGIVRSYSYGVFLKLWYHFGRFVVKASVGFIGIIGVSWFLLGASWKW